MRDVLRIGALTTYTEIIESKLVQKRVPMLVAAAREVGGAQIQNRGTLGGNIANASPAGDTLPVLAAARRAVVLRSHTGERTVPFDSFYTGYRTSVRQPDELIVAIEIPAHRRPPVVAQGRHAARAGDLEDHDGRRARARRAHRVWLGRADRGAREAGRAVLSSGGSIADAQAACSRRSRRSTMSDRPASIGRRWRQICSRSFWSQTSMTGCVWVLGCCGVACGCCVLVCRWRRVAAAWRSRRA